MQLSKLVKAVMLALPVIAVTACSSTNNSAPVPVGNETVTASKLPKAQLKILENLSKVENSTVYFAFDKYSINSKYTKLLDEQANFLLNNPTVAVVIEGNADERGTPEYNIALGERRANAVKVYLQSRGVPGSQISIVSYGKEKPAVLGHTEEAYAKNRRAIIVY